MSTIGHDSRSSLSFDQSFSTITTAKVDDSLLFSSLKPSQQEECIWNVTNENLAPLGPHFRLERTSRHIAETDAYTVASRICEILQARSVEAEFDVKNATAKCFTSNFVRFEIHLFSGENSSVHVEVQKRRGSNLFFMAECRAILDAAEGKIDKQPEQWYGTDSIFPPHILQLPPRKMACLKNAYSKDEAKQRESDSQVDIERIQNLLEENSAESTILALQLLSNMTGASNEYCEGVITTNVLTQGKLIQTKFMEIIENDYLNSMDTNNTDNSYMFRKINLLMLTALKHAFINSSKQESMKALLKQEWIANKLVPYFTNIIKDSAQNTHDACVALECLWTLMVNSDMSFFCGTKKEEMQETLRYVTDTCAKSNARLARALALVDPMIH